MEQLINHNGLKRLGKLELSRTQPTTREEASRIMYGRVGAYDRSGTAIEAGIDSYFAGEGVVN